MTKDEAKDLLREVVRLERIARALREHVAEAIDGPAAYHLNCGDAQTALEIMEEG